MSLNPEKLQQMFNVLKADVIRKTETELSICKRNLEPNEQYPLNEKRKAFLEGQLARLQAIRDFLDLV